MSGWIKLHRSLLDWEWYQDANALRLLVHLLVSVNYEDKRWQGNVIKAGELITSYENLGDILGLTKQQVKTALKKLETSGEITRARTRHCLHLQLVKWSELQSKQPDDNPRITRQQPDNNPTITPTKEYKEYKEIKEEKKRELFLTWLDYRKSIKKGITNQQTLDRLIEKFNLHTFEQIQTVIDYSIDNGYQGLFWDKQTAQQSDNGLKRNSKGELYNPKTHLPDGRLKAAL